MVPVPGDTHVIRKTDRVLIPIVGLHFDPQVLISCGHLASEWLRVITGLDTGLILVMSDHLTQMLASDWPVLPSY